VNISNLLKSTFRGVSQVMLQNNVLSGLIILIAIFCSSWLMGVGAVIGVLVSTITAILFKFKDEDIKIGLYGFNGTLVGIALLFYFKPTIPLFILLIIASGVSTFVMDFMYKRKLSPFTFPFILTTWVFILLINALNIVAPVIFTAGNPAQPDIISGICLDFGQVMFQANIITGVLFF